MDCRLQSRGRFSALVPVHLSTLIPRPGSGNLAEICKLLSPRTSQADLTGHVMMNWKSPFFEILIQSMAANHAEWVIVSQVGSDTCVLAGQR
jgi:hypothetical protein